MRNSYLLLILMFLVFHKEANSQRIFRFSEDPEVFNQELSAYMGPNLTKEEQMFLVSFDSLWNSGHFSENSKNRIIEISSMLAQLRIRPVPHFINFLYLLNTTYEKSLSDEDVKKILNGVYMLPSSQGFTMAAFNDFLLRLTRFFKDGTVFSSNSVQWKVNRLNYSLKSGDKFEIQFTQVDLIGKARNDSLVIYNTSARYLPFEFLWLGTNGLIKWEKAGLPESEVYAELKTYEIVLSRQDFNADSALFTNSIYFNEPILGRVTDRISRLGNPSDSDYPRFESYSHDLSIDNIYRGIYYKGGVSMHGGRLIGSGTAEKNASLKIHNSDSLLITARSRSFVFLPNRAFSNNTKLLIHLGTDSIYHPELAFNYNTGADEVSFFRTERAMSRSPYSNTYHKMDMTFEQLIWKRGDSLMYFTMPRASVLGIANFESFNFFNSRNYEMLQGMDAQHPLILVRNFRNYFMGENLPVIDFANWARKNVSEIRHLLLDLALRGYIFYDFENDYFRIREKLINTLQANTGRIDYDIINFVSNTEAPTENATFNLNTYELRINGIPRVFISSIQNVNIFPANNRVIVKQDRNFQFDGIINAGNLTFYGSNFFFDYKDFKITLQNVDSVSLRAETGQADEMGRRILAEVQNQLRNVTGILYVDKPGNKSGRKFNSDYPKFSSTEFSTVLFNDPGIQKGTLSADKVYFQVNPFQMDSLNTFQNKDLRFTGKFVSGGILPEIEQNLVLQPDYSLGFTYMAPPGGVPVYGGKGMFYESINLSNRGIVGTGRLNFETTEIRGKEFVFYPDSMNLMEADLTVKQRTSGSQFPYIQSKNNTVQWLPESNQMTVRQNDTPFIIHNQNTTLSGNISISPSGVTGSGNLTFSDANISAGKFIFTATESLTDSADFTIRLPAHSENSFSGNNFSAKINHASGKGEFQSNEGINRVEFPINRYVGFVEKMEWNIPENLLRLHSSRLPENEEYTGARYLSIHPGQDSLSFVAPHLEYNYSTTIMNASGVNHLRVADAYIYPNEGRLTVKAGADMRAMENSVIVANRLSKLHRIYDAITKVESSKKYTAKGYYNYVDKTGEPQKILFEKVEVDTSGQTVAKGSIIEPQGFTLSPYFEYQGNVSMAANNPLLHFKGGVRIVHECETLHRTWLSFESEINPDSIYIPVVANPTNLNRDRIFSGTLIGNDSIYIYPSFISFRRRFNDAQISSAGQYLYFEEEFDRYVKGSREKLENREVPGNLLLFNRKQCILTSQGKINPDINLGQLKLEAFGTSIHNIAENSLEMDLMLTMDFFFSDPALQIFARELDSLPGPETVFFRNPGNRLKIQELTGSEKAEALWKEIEAGGNFITVPAELNKTIVINRVQLKWNQGSRSYQSYGRMEISNLKGKPVHKSVNGFLEISKRRSGDFIDLYIEISPNNWYYFGYTRGVMVAFSTNNAFNQALMLPPVKQRQLAVKSGETSYIYMIATDTRIGQFLTRYQRIMQLRNEGKSEEMDIILDEDIIQ